VTGSPERKVSIREDDGCWRGVFRAMASPCEILCETEDREEARRVSNLAAAEAWRIENKFSRYLPDNIVHRINTAGGKRVEVDAETAQLLDFAITLYELSDRRFDITSGVLRTIWTFDGGDEVPAETDVAAVLERVGWHRVTWNRPNLKMPSSMEIDLGGIGKEYAVDRATGLLRAESPASCLVNLGGDLAVTRPPIWRASWKVGIEAGQKPSYETDKILSISSGALATSGDARRFVIRDGVRYSHILDPRTGWPVPDAPRSVTVAADTCTQAGMLSTLAMLEGAGAEAFLDREQVSYWCRRERSSHVVNSQIAEKSS
jgi:thiamine biosynthesis lipoprotein